MDIHKPKAAHSWREFAVEIGTIICGILIALSLEQGVEGLHHRHLAEQAEDDLAAGLKPDLVLAAGYQAFEPCEKARIKDLAGLLQSRGAAWAANPAPTYAGQPPSSAVFPRVVMASNGLWAHAPWEWATTSGVLVYMPRERVARYAEAYRIVDLIRSRQAQTFERMQSIAPLAYERTLTDEDKAAYLSALYGLDDLSTGATALSRQLLREAHYLGIEPDARSLKQSLDTLRPFGPCVRAVTLPLPDPTGGLPVAGRS